MEKFTHGIIAINPNKVDEHGNVGVLHFVGFWDEPKEEDVLGVWEELQNTEEFGLQDQINEIDLIPAPDDVLEHFNSIMESGNVEDITKHEN